MTNVVLLRALAAFWICATAFAQSPLEPTTSSTQQVPAGTDLNQSFTFRMCVKMDAAPVNLPTIAATKAWEEGAVRDYTTNNSFGLGRESGKRPGFAISVLPDGAWTWNAGDGRRRIDHRPEAADQGIADGKWHEIGFAIDRAAGVAHLYHDGRRVAIHDLQGVAGLAVPGAELQLASKEGVSIAAVRFDARAMSPARVRAAFVARFGKERAPAVLPQWHGRPLRVLAWNIWHGGRRKGRDAGVQRVVDVIRECNADIVLMQETYGSGPRISGRLGFDYFLRSSNLSVMSRYPIVATHRLASGFRFGGVTIELRPGKTVQAYSLWINHLPSVRKQLADGASADELRAADQKTRGKEIAAILAQLLPHLAKAPDVPVIVGGDFNSGSHLDWTKAAAEQPHHHGRVVTWPVSQAMADANFIDAFRTAHPDPVAAPGHTWSPEFSGEHQDRIDYVYARGDDWRVLDSRVLSHHEDGWPSDHAATFASLDLVDPVEAKQKTLRVMSYNIHYGLGMDGERSLERIAQVVRDHAPDLVGLQEISNDAMAQELGRLTGMKVVFGPSKGKATEYGDAVLSRLPFALVANHAIPSASSSRYQAMAVDVDVSTLFGNDRKVRLINTHFDWLQTIGSKEARLASASLIDKAFCSDSDLPMILTGDLNALPGSEPLRRLAGMGWTQGVQVPGLLTIGPAMAPPDRQIDYVLVRPAPAWRIRRTYVADEPVASDHRPVVMTIALEQQ